MGLLNLVVPEEYGGPGLDSVTIAMIYEELGRAVLAWLRPLLQMLLLPILS